VEGWALRSRSCRLSRQGALDSQTAPAEDVRIDQRERPDLWAALAVEWDAARDSAYAGLLSAVGIACQVQEVGHPG
jgi:hypothetical protein